MIRLAQHMQKPNRNMRRLTVLFICLARVVLAQASGDLLEELRQTDQVIARVRPVVEQSQVREAKRLLAVAEEQQRAAWQAYENSHPRRALELTRRARQNAQQAERLAKDPEGERKRQEQERARAREELRRTAEALTELGPLIRRAEEPSANELWKMAETEQTTAEDAFGRERYGIAIKFTLAAREHVRAALGLLKRSADPERIAQVLDRTDELLRRAAEPVKTSANQRAIDLLAKAAELQSQARSALRERRWVPAVKLSLAARELLLKAWEMVRGQLTPELIEQAIAETEELVRQWSGTIRQPGNSRAEQLLDQAALRLESARQHLAEKRLKPALAEACAAQKLMTKAIALLQPRNDASLPTEDN